MAGRLVTVATYGNLIEAQLARSALESAGIRTLIVGEHTAGNFHYHMKSIPIFAVTCTAAAMSVA